MPHDHGKPGHLGGDAQEWVLAFDVVGEAGGGDYGSADDQPGKGKPVQREPGIQRQDENDSTTADRGLKVGTPFGGFVDNFEILRHPEIHEHPSEECDEKQGKVKEFSEDGKHRLRDEGSSPARSGLMYRQR